MGRVVGDLIKGAIPCRHVMGREDISFHTDISHLNKIAET